MNTRTQAKSLPVPGAPAVDPTQPADGEPTPEELVDQHEWAGDLFEDTSQITDPAEAFASFQGPEGESAWLDRAPDGTLTAWVRDADGSVYRYTDADAWAIDVDQAGMNRTDAAAAPTEAIDALEDPAGGAGTEDGEVTAEGDEPGAPVDDPAEPVDPAEPAGEDEEAADPAEETDVDDETDPADPEEEDEEDEDELDLFGTIEGKSWLAPGGVGRLVARPL